MYVVTKRGIYLQEVYGPYIGMGKARKAAAVLMEFDPIPWSSLKTDDYHAWAVERVTKQGLEEIYEIRPMGKI